MNEGKKYSIIISTLLIMTIFSVNVLGDDNNPPLQPTDPFPNDGATGVGFFDYTEELCKINLSWKCQDPDVNDTLLYDIYFGGSLPLEIIELNCNRTWFVISDDLYEPGLKSKTTYYWQIIVWDDKGAFNSSDIWSFTTKKYPPLVREWSYSPSNPAPGVEICFDASNSFGIGENVTYLWLWETPGTGKMENWGNDPIAYHTYEYPILHKQVRLRVKNNDGEYQDWIRCITVRDPEQEPPYKPTITGPSQGKINQEYDYFVQTTDPNNDDIFYLFDFGDGTISPWIGPVESGVGITLSHTWTKEGTYQIRARAFDSAYHESSEWSEPIIVSMPKIHSYNPIIQLLSQMLERFPFLQSLFFF